MKPHQARPRVRWSVGPSIVIAMPVLTTGLWILFPPENTDGRSAFARQVLSEFMGSMAVVLFATSLVLGTRARWLEPWFGGLDKMYRVHREVGVLGFVILVAHVVLAPWRLSPGGGVPAGLLALIGFTVMVALSVGPHIPVLRRVFSISYGRWRRTHRFIGLFFIMALAHTLLIDALVATTAPPFILLMAAYVAGIVAFVYSLMLARFIRQRRRYSVNTVRRLNSSTVEIGFRPRREHKAVPYRSGQFVFVRFQRRGLREPHPFTVSSAPHEPLLRLTIKAAGDFTRRLHEHIEPGVKAIIEGSYGMMDYRAGKPIQIWFAGGIGVTPFLSWCRGLDGNATHEVDFFYTVRHAEDALFLDELKAIARCYPWLRLHLHVSSESGTITVPRIARHARCELAKASVYMCGPVPMVNALNQGFKEAGVPAASIHFEEFSFR